MIIKKVDLLMTAGNKSQYPETDYPEVAFAGRSNVGKSSLINVLINRKRFARTSAKPGKTQTINFYSINDSQMLVDLPGYGYAKVSKKEREKWGKMIEEYLNDRDQLKDVILLVDIRHVPSQNDVLMYNWIRECGFEGYVVATKADKISKGKRQKHIADIRKALGIDDVRKIIPFSASDKLNRDAVWTKIKELSEK
ncbi:GTP-binding protein [Dethiosulfatibacter aminovorans DSM 17477]|uniref:Probable GTP-binding protein EngB n=1 Tax=Dethiosulfatibacter aminovorans DSM 17477 TaxID=1121476 RepID=A0A1M6M8C4_9FIRM|nr:ribosome biogenesis GTP-binding protein YihA/YsxC [Dethiosulfatibacter aminovorans]SHJ79719.1 GTP-binding protein [Dethiosulfatibacter aminovorans DSM 17477]